MNWTYLSNGDEIAVDAVCLHLGTNQVTYTTKQTNNRGDFAVPRNESGHKFAIHSR